MKKLIVYLQGYRKESILGPFFKLLEAAFELIVPLVMARIIDVGIENKDKPYVVAMCAVIILLGIVGLVCSITAQYYAAKAAVGFSCNLRGAVFSHIQTLSFSELDEIGTSTVITRLTSDINQVQTGVNLFLRLLLRSPFIVFGAFLMAFIINKRLSLIFIAAIFVLFIIVFAIMLLSIPLYKKIQARLDGVLLSTRENILGTRVLHAFNKENDEIRDYEKKTTELSRLQIFVGKISALMNPLTYVIINIGVIAVIYFGSHKVENTKITQGELIALVNYMLQILVELVKLANLIITVTKSIACAKRVEAVLEYGEKKKNTESINNFDNDSTAVEFDKVYFKYKGAGDYSLEDISFNVRKGETVGIIGGTGSGKTTLVNLIPDFYEIDSGVIKVFGQDVRSCNKDKLRNKIGIVMQKAVVFKGTVRENLLWGKKDATEEEMIKALEASQALDFVMQKRGGLDYEILQGGKNLSGGQKQRISIAMTLISKPDILILDESSSALDFSTEKKLREAIKKFKNNMTLFIVSKRASAISGANTIVVLDDGRAVGIGGHEYLLESCSVYKEICNSQK